MGGGGCCTQVGCVKASTGNAGKSARELQLHFMCMLLEFKKKKVILHRLRLHYY